jgi:hypothetical protein
MFRSGDKIRVLKTLSRRNERPFFNLNAFYLSTLRFGRVENPMDSPASLRQFRRNRRLS